MGHHLVTGIRLNTVMPVKGGQLKEKLSELKRIVSPKILWVDLKARQIRITDFANTPYTAVTISHKIGLHLPATVYFDNGSLTGKVVEIDGNKLILEGYAGRLLGPGESVNITDGSLTYLEPSIFTDKDLAYIEACGEVGLTHFMLSYVESPEDVAALKRLNPAATVMSKLESKKALRNLTSITGASDYIMAARGDLFTELDYPHQIGAAMKLIREAGLEKACAASRMLESILRHPVPSCSDMMDLCFLKELGFRLFLIGDDLCFNKDLLFKAFAIFGALFDDKEWTV